MTFRADDWVVEACAKISPFLIATTPIKGVLRVAGNGGLAVEFSFDMTEQAAREYVLKTVKNLFSKERPE